MENKKKSPEKFSTMFFHQHRVVITKMINKICREVKFKGTLPLDDLKMECWRNLIAIKLDINRTLEEQFSYIKQTLRWKINDLIEREGNLIRIPRKVQHHLIRVRSGIENKTTETKRILKLQEINYLDDLQEETFTKIPNPEEVHQEQEFNQMVKVFKEMFLTEKEIKSFDEIYGSGEKVENSRFIRSNFKKRFKRSKVMKEFLGKYKDLINKILRRR